MKKYCLFAYIVGLACACLTLIGCETTQPAGASAPPPDSGTLVIDRVANFGTDNRPCLVYRRERRGNPY